MKNKLTEKKASIEVLYKNIFSIKESLQDAISTAQETANVASEFGGEISRVITSQINDYLIPVLSKYIEDSQTPGAVAPLITFLDSVPLAMTREEPTPEVIAPSPVDTTVTQQVQAPPTLEGAAVQESTHIDTGEFLPYTIIWQDNEIADFPTKEEAEAWLLDLKREHSVNAADFKIIYKDSPADPYEMGSAMNEGRGKLGHMANPWNPDRIEDLSPEEQGAFRPTAEPEESIQPTSASDIHRDVNALVAQGSHPEEAWADVHEQYKDVMNADEFWKTWDSWEPIRESKKPTAKSVMNKILKKGSGFSWLRKEVGPDTTITQLKNIMSKAGYTKEFNDAIAGYKESKIKEEEDSLLSDDNVKELSDEWGVSEEETKAALEKAKAESLVEE